MPKPTLRHLAIMTMNPHKLAIYYEQVFEMEIVTMVHDPIDGEYAVLTDGYMTLALLPQHVNLDTHVGIHHFGFHIASLDNIRRRIAAGGFAAPESCPSNVPYAEFKTIDADGNPIELSENGYQRVPQSKALDEEPAKV